MEPKVERALRDLAAAVAASQVVERARRAREEVQGREAARIMLRDLETLQGEILQAAQRGEPVSEDLAARYRQVAELASYNPYVRELLQAEAELAQLLDEVQREVLRAAGVAPPEERSSDGQAATPETPGDAFGAPGGGGGQAARDAKVHAARSRLWVPGQGHP